MQWRAVQYISYADDLLILKGVITNIKLINMKSGILLALAVIGAAAPGVLCDRFIILSSVMQLID